MDEALKAIVYGVVGTFLWVLIEQGFRKARIRTRQRAMRRAWSFIHKEVTIVHPLYLFTDAKPIPRNYAQIDDIVAMHILKEFLGNMGVECSVQDDSHDVPRETDLMLICGPLANKHSARFDELGTLPFRFEKSEGDQSVVYLVDTESGVEYWSPADRSGAKKDFGLVARYTNNNPRQRVFLLWGIHGVGTLAAVKFALSAENIKSVVQAVGDEDFAILVQAPFSRPGEVGDASALTPPKLIGHGQATGSSNWVG